MVCTKLQVLICSICGNQSQAHHEEEEGADDARAGRRRHFAKPKKIKEVFDPAEHHMKKVADVIKAYCSTLQDTLLVSH